MKINEIIKPFSVSSYLPVYCVIVIVPTLVWEVKLASQALFIFTHRPLMTMEAQGSVDAGISSNTLKVIEQPAG